MEFGTTNTSWSIASFRYDMTVVRIISCSTSEKDDVALGFAWTVDDVDAKRDDATNGGMICCTNTVTPPNMGRQTIVISGFGTVPGIGY